MNSLYCRLWGWELGSTNETWEQLSSPLRNYGKQNRTTNVNKCLPSGWKSKSKRGITCFLTQWYFLPFGVVFICLGKEAFCTPLPPTKKKRQLKQRNRLDFPNNCLKWRYKSWKLKWRRQVSWISFKASKVKAWKKKEKIVSLSKI